MNKNRVKSLIFGIETRIVAIISEGVVIRAGKNVVMRRVKSEILRHKFLNDAEKNSLYLFAVSFYRKCVAACGRKTDEVERSDRVYSVLRNSVDELEHKKNEIANEIEHRVKHRELVSVLRSEDKFYYCTVLPDPAKGHAMYQGKIYFKGHAEYSEEEKEFITSKGLLSVEEVVLDDPWLCTRLNCRHRLIPISFNKVKSGDYDVVREKPSMSYDEQQYRAYYDRLKLFVFLDKKITSPQLKIDIKRTRNLVKKWKKKK